MLRVTLTLSQTNERHKRPTQMDDVLLYMSKTDKNNNLYNERIKKKDNKKKKKTANHTVC